MGKASVQDPLIGTVVGGRYEIMRLIGKGGMGAIYEVRNTRLGRQFALKTLTGDAAGDPEVLQRFRREADVISKIKHPNIVEVIDWEALADGSPAMVMEYLQGEDLGARIKDGALPWPQLARVADQVLAALSIAHANGVVHRDLKPQNIFLAQDDSGEEKVKLLDFGVSKVRDSKSFVTTDARLLGTPAYMSPEQAEGRADKVGTHTDVWAIGTILFEMATGEVPFDAGNLPAILYKICHSTAPLVSTKRADAPEPFVELVRETLERDINKRIADATVLRVRLREVLRALPGVQFSESLAGTRRSTPSVSPGGRRKRFTDALDDTLGAVTPSNEKLAAGTPVPQGLRVGTENTLLAPTTNPSMLRRRKWAPVMLAVAAIALASIVITIVVASRPTSSTAAESTVAKPAEPAAAIDAGGLVETPAVAPDAPAEVASDASPVESPTSEPTKPRLTKPERKTTARAERSKTDPARTEPQKTEPQKTEPQKTEPQKTEPAKAEPAKKKCAKDDFECLYGDGT